MSTEILVKSSLDVPQNGVYVEVLLGQEGDVAHRYVALDSTIAAAAENAALDYIQTTGAFPSDQIYCLCYWSDGAIFGPFPVEINLTATAQLLRGNADEIAEVFEELDEEEES